MKTMRREMRKHVISCLSVASLFGETACSRFEAESFWHGTEGTSEDAIRNEERIARSTESVAAAIRSWVATDADAGRDHASEDFQRTRRKNNSRRRRRTRQRERQAIVGGTTARPGRFPYAVSLQLEKVLDVPDEASSEESEGAEVSDVHTCGGTLIAMDVVLTAGHCGYEELPSSEVTSAQGSVNSQGQVNFGMMPTQIFYGADVGAYNITAGNEGGYTNMLFEKLHLHPDYTGFHGKGNSQMSLQHDVMLVKLYGASDKPFVRLHDPSLGRRSHREPVEGEGLVVIGWGDTDPNSSEKGSSLASVLQQATVSYVPNDVCENSKGYSSIQSSTTNFEDYFEYDGTISEDMMCARGGGDVVQDACQGDSGGGLIRLGDDINGSQDVQVGIVSWGLQCGDADFPGVYARVGDHYDWIREKVCEISDSPPGYLQCPPNPYPPGSPYDPVVDLTVTIQFDDYRSETGWLLESLPDFRNIVFRSFGHYTPEDSVDEDNSMSETIPVHSGRFYMLSILDEFADGFCCQVGEGYFRVESADEEYPIVDTTPGILWSPHALRRAFYVSPPNQIEPPNFVTIVVTLGIGADPGKFLLLGLENVKYEALFLYEIRPFLLVSDARTGAGSKVYSRTFKVPILGAEFKRQRYHVVVYDDNEESQASFDVYFGDPDPKNLLLAQSGSYGDKNNISRSFVLFKRFDETIAPEYSDQNSSALDVNQIALQSKGSILRNQCFVCMLLMVSIAFHT